ncbi:MAG TPA: M20 family metallopeptidase [Planctomycetota bacterium]|nr:M20 family metallopeptidase [Planctomycetota bacterium]
MDRAKASALIDAAWDRSIVPTLVDYIRIPNKSPAFDAEWHAHGHMDKAVNLIAGWCRDQNIEGMKLEVVRLNDEKGRPRTPLIFMEIPAFGPQPSGRDPRDCVLLYGHLDKQPEMVGWFEGLGPWTPVLKDDKLYGRGGADDGYAAFASLTAIRALREQGVPHARCVVVIEACEESGSYDLPFYIDHLAERIGTPSLVVCLDSGCGNYEQLWCTTSLRGIAAGTLKVQVLTEGVHSGDASGIVPSSFRIARALLSRLEDEKTGAILPKEFHVEIPAERREQAAAAARVLGDPLHRRFPFAGQTRAMADDLTELVLNRTWRPFLEITGAEGLPSIANAGNVLRPFTALKLSLRLPPSCDPEKATAALRALLEKDPPYGAQVTFDGEHGAAGWNAPPLQPWLRDSIERASQAWFGKEAVSMGEGGTIPFMGMLGAKFPKAQFMITGVLGPGSNAHGPNEFLHLPMGKKLTGAVAQVVADHLHRA